MVKGAIGNLPPLTLDLAATLHSGQVFRWVQDASGIHHGMVGQHCLQLSQSADGTTVYFAADTANAEALVRSFLRLDDTDLPAFAALWAKIDPLFADAWGRQPGVRLLRQDPHECFFSFLCASVAPIKRISGMLTATANECGTCYENGLTAFPTAAQLASVGETRLRELGLGFRARRVAEAAKRMQALPEGWLESLRHMPHQEARTLLCRTFHGIGWKIADCILLFSLDHDSAVPVDTHIWRIAQTYYLPELRGKSLTPANYTRVTEAFRERFGDKAGWAQQILFYRSAVGRKGDEEG